MRFYIVYDPVTGRHRTTLGEEDLAGPRTLTQGPWAGWTLDRSLEPADGDGGSVAAAAETAAVEEEDIFDFNCWIRSGGDAPGLEHLRKVRNQDYKHDQLDVDWVTFPYVLKGRTVADKEQKALVTCSTGGTRVHSPYLLRTGGLAITYSDPDPHRVGQDWGTAVSESLVEAEIGVQASIFAGSVKMNAAGGADGGAGRTGRNLLPDHWPHNSVYGHWSAAWYNVGSTKWQGQVVMAAWEFPYDAMLSAEPVETQHYHGYWCDTILRWNCDLP